MTSGATPLLSKIGQVALAVRDMAQAVEFYRDRVGLRFLFQAPNVAFFDCGGTRLMLGQNEDPQKTPYGTVLYFQVADIQQAFATLKERSVPVIREPHLIAKMPEYDLWMAFFRDLDENVFAIMSEVRR